MHSSGAKHAFNFVSNFSVCVGIPDTLKIDTRDYCQ
jgi:hypothetical protein